MSKGRAEIYFQALTSRRVASTMKFGNIIPRIVKLIFTPAASRQVCARPDPIEKAIA
jgi:hypothetical protein